MQIRPITAQEFEDFVRCNDIAFGAAPRPETVPHSQALFEYDRSLAAFDGGRVVAQIGAYSLTLSVPGGELPTAGTSWASVLPTHRRRGLLTALLRRHLDDVRERGEPLAALWASEAGIYGRFGYGSAAPVANVEVTREGALGPLAAADGPLAAAGEGTVRLVAAPDAASACSPVYERMRAQRPGALSRSAGWWTHGTLIDYEHERGDRSDKLVAVYDAGERPEGYVIYRVNAGDEERSFGTVEVQELVANTPRATGALWRFLIETDLTRRVVAERRPVDDPLPFLLAEPRAARWGVGDGLWVRLADLPAALRRRAYADTDDLTLEVADSFCPWNAGTWLLAARADGSDCERTGRVPDLVLDAGTLASAYLGGVPVTQLAAAGLVRASTNDAVNRLDRLLRVPLAPWPVEDF